MSTDDTHREAVEVLQQLGLKEYEAKCFVGLSRLSKGTAKQLSDITEVPRTRIYDAIRVLEAQGLVEIHHSSPKKFRAVSIEEATETLRDQYDDRVDRLESMLEQVQQVDPDDEETVQEVWAMTGADAAANRTEKLIDDASDEIVLVLGHESLLSDDLIAALKTRTGDTDVIIGAVTETLEERIKSEIPAARTFVSGLEWLQHDSDPTDDLAIGRLMLVDRAAILVSTLDTKTGEEHAVYGGGFGNGLIVMARRLLGQGLVPAAESPAS
jgi:sugar-specific transcriptional regulator TrmB